MSDVRSPDEVLRPDPLRPRVRSDGATASAAEM